ncbi:hypothetical protein LMG28138_04790 [Pararobbsia alpina]|uniref:Uncharacterized protein n=1 Tax=Pararobbsia alpina TaxID=621374 RepID=A0A6S7BH18_9BURK|nr:hypothetical protein LMG28138_04790 [Pararobbsia alpina]
MSSGAPAALRPVSGGRPDKMRNCPALVFKRSARFRGKVKARIRSFLSIFTKFVQADVGTALPAPIALYGTGPSAKALTLVDNFVWDQTKHQSANSDR